jgi:hypothetical protein
MFQLQNEEAVTRLNILKMDYLSTVQKFCADGVQHGSTIKNGFIILLNMFICRICFGLFLWEPSYEQMRRLRTCSLLQRRMPAQGLEKWTQRELLLGKTFGVSLRKQNYGKMWRLQTCSLLQRQMPRRGLETRKRTRMLLGRVALIFIYYIINKNYNIT